MSKDTDNFTSSFYYFVNKASDDALKKELWTLTQHQIKRLRKIAGEVINQKYDMKSGRSKPLYGNLPKKFSLSELEQIFAKIDNTRLRMAFAIQFLLGLRIGELSNLEIVPNQGIVKICSNKSKKIDFLPLLPCVEQLIIKYQSGVMFNHNYLRKVFRDILKEVGLNYAYAISDDNRKLHQFSTHSLRHTAVNMFSEFVGDDYKTCCFSRHTAQSRMGTQAAYRHYSLDELREDYSACFGELAKNLSMTDNFVPLTLRNDNNRRLLHTMECLGFDDHAKAMAYAYAQFNKVALGGFPSSTPDVCKLSLLSEDSIAHGHSSERQTFVHYYMILSELEAAEGD